MLWAGALHLWVMWDVAPLLPTVPQGVTLAPSPPLTCHLEPPIRVWRYCPSLTMKPYPPPQSGCGATALH